MNNITDYHIKLMEHTISGPDRNWFGTNSNDIDAESFNELVSMGYATSEPAPKWMGDDIIFRLTVEGKAQL